MKTRNHKIYVVALSAALGLTASYVAAQNRPDAGVACCDKQCPMKALRELAEVQVESNDFGAALQFSAKNRSKVTEIQGLVAKLAEHLKSAADCRMHGGAGPHGHEHKGGK